MHINQALMTVALAGSLVSCRHHEGRVHEDGNAARDGRPMPAAFEPFGPHAASRRDWHRAAWFERGPGRPEPGAMAGEFARYLYPPRLVLREASAAGLRDDQITKIRQEVFDTEVRRTDLESKLKKEKLELDRLLAGGTLDQNQLFAKLDEMAKSKLELQKQRVGLMLRVRDLLTPEQRHKLDELRANAGRGHERPHGPKGGRSLLRR